MYGISRSETDGSGNDSTKKEKEVVNVLEPVVSTRVARIYEDPNALAQPEDTHVGEFGTKRDLVRWLIPLCSPIESLSHWPLRLTIWDGR